jgi:hypothetical protein
VAEGLPATVGRLNEPHALEILKRSSVRTRTSDKNVDSMLWGLWLLLAIVVAIAAFWS